MQDLTQQLTWTGSLAILNPVLLGLALVFAGAALSQIVLSFLNPDTLRRVNPDGTLAARAGRWGWRKN